LWYVRKELAESIRYDLKFERVLFLSCNIIKWYMNFSHKNNCYVVYDDEVTQVRRASSNDNILRW